VADIVWSDNTLPADTYTLCWGPRRRINLVVLQGEDMTESSQPGTRWVLASIRRLRRDGETILGESPLDEIAHAEWIDRAATRGEVSCHSRKFPGAS